jgi:hypothetical protein
MGSRCDATKKGRLSWAAGREVVIWRTRTVRTVRNRRPGENPSEARLRPSVGIWAVWVEEVDPVQTAFLKWHRMDTTPPSPIISARPGSLNKDLLLWIGSAALSSVVLYRQPPSPVLDGHPDAPRPAGSIVQTLTMRVVHRGCLAMVHYRSRYQCSQCYKLTKEKGRENFLCASLR